MIASMARIPQSTLAENPGERENSQTSGLFDFYISLEI